MKPPAAPRRDHVTVVHGHQLEDPYAWLRDPSYPDVTEPDVLEYLNAENAYFDAYMHPRGALVEELFAELKARQPRSDESVPYLYRGFEYQWRFAIDAQYRTWHRRRPCGAWELLFDEPERASAADYYRLGALSPSRGGNRLAFSEDTDGSERFRLQIIDIASGAPLIEPVSDTIGEPVWSVDGTQLFYVALDAQWRPYQVRRLNVDSGQDVEVYREEDPAFIVSLDTTSDETQILITSGTHVTSECYLLPADAPTATPRCIAPRRDGHEYHVDRQGDALYILTNDRHRNFRLVSAPADNPEPHNWTEVIAADDDVYWTGLSAFASHLVLTRRVRGLSGVVIRDANHRMHEVAMPEPAYSVGLGTNADYHSPFVRLVYTSMVTPTTVFDCVLATGALETRKIQQIPSGYDPTGFTTERLNVPVRNGASVPVSIVMPKGFREQGGGPLVLYGYGAYGHAIEPAFSANRLSLLTRGFAYAIAHIRGGDDLGYAWYEAGKLDKRTNTFNDFVDCARYLVDEGFTHTGAVFASGGSAGGELVAAAVNQARGLWGGAVLHVPFVDVLNTMLDATLPLTPIEWPEWGNPIEDAKAFEHIRSYSPYDQLEPGDYPPLLVTAGLNDPRVTYWEPAKYVAKVRHLKTDDDVVLLKTNMAAGHGGKSGRYDALREVAEEYVFCLVEAGVSGDAESASGAR